MKSKFIKYTGTNACLTCETETKYDQCPACNPEAFIDECHQTTVDECYTGLAFLTKGDFDTRIQMIKAMIRSIDEDTMLFSGIISNLCAVLIRSQQRHTLKLKKQKLKESN